MPIPPVDGLAAAALAVRGPAPAVGSKDGARSRILISMLRSRSAASISISPGLPA